MKIVIVEDNPGIREELSRFLERYGYETAVPDSFEGMPQNILELSPDLVLLDLNLPVYDGYYVCRELCLNLSRSSVSYGGKELELSKNEARILHCLMKEPERIHSREEIMEALWQTDCFVDDNTLTVNVTRLRKRLASIGAGEFISTKRGQGYLL